MKLPYLPAIPKQRLKQWLARKLNIRYSHYHGYRFFWDAACYPELASVAQPVIFDVGANIGQTAVAFCEWFPHAKVHCFEPSPPSFAKLEHNMAGLSVACHKLALSDESGRVKVKLINDDPACTVNSLDNLASGKDNSNAVWFDVDTLPAFMQRNGIPTIHILKIDTEGRDLQILKGAEPLLASGAIWNIVVETTASKRDDSDHIPLVDFIHFLEPFGFVFYSLFDIMHERDGRVSFMNAMFKRRNLPL